MNIFLLVIIIGIIVIGAIWSMYKIMTEADKIYTELDQIEQDAKNATTVDELRACWSQLGVLSTKSFHKTISGKINKVAAYINGKAEVLMKQETQN